MAGMARRLKAAGHGRKVHSLTPYLLLDARLPDWLERTAPSAPPALPSEHFYCTLVPTTTTDYLRDPGCWILEAVPYRCPPCTMYVHKVHGRHLILSSFVLCTYIALDGMRGAATPTSLASSPSRRHDQKPASLTSSGTSRFHLGLRQPDRDGAFVLIRKKNHHRQAQACSACTACTACTQPQV